MPSWTAGRRGDLFLRLVGVMLLLISAVSLRTLARIHPAPTRLDSGLIDFALAAIGFLGASTGAGLAVLGNHLFDEVEVSERWRSRRDPNPDVAKTQAPTLMNKVCVHPHHDAHG